MDKKTRIGQIVIDLYPGSIKEATFEGVVGPNDILSCKITLQRDYAQYLNAQHLEHKAQALEDKRLKIEEDKTEKEKQIQIEKEKELTELRTSAKKEGLEAEIAELKVKLAGDLEEAPRKVMKNKLIRLKGQLADMNK